MAAQGAGARWWRRGRDEALSRARTAAAAAATAFVDLDALQRRTALQVEAFTALQGGPAGDRLSREWVAVQRTGDAAVAGYLAVSGRYDVTTDLPEPDARQAAADYDRAGAALLRALTAMRDFSTRAATRFARVEQAVARLGTAGRDAAAAVAAARAAITAAERAGTPAHDAVAALHDAERAWTVIQEGPAVHGLRAAVAAADTVLAQAARATALAVALPAQRVEVRHALAATRTRLEAVTTRRDRLPAVLSALRRSFVTSSYADVEGLPAAADRHLVTARDHLATAARHLTAHHLPRARAAIAAARRDLDAAGEAVDGVSRRHTALQELRRDPQAPVRRTRFAVREAQRLFVFLGPRADQRYATQLDSLVSRVAAAAEAFHAPHPDYWRLDRDLARIRDETAEVVRRLRGI